MKTASQLSDPIKYSFAYNKGVQDAKDGKSYANPYDMEADCERYSGYSDGYNETDKKHMIDDIINSQ